MRSKTKSILLLLAALILITPVLLVLLAYTNPAMMRTPLEALVRQSTGLRLEIGGEFQLKPSGTPHLVAGDLTLSNPQLPDSPDAVKRYVRFGASPRAAQGLIRASKVRALMEGRFHVAFDDIRALAYPVLRHRMHLNFDGISEGRTVESVIEELLAALDRQMEA